MVRFILVMAARIVAILFILFLVVSVQSGYSFITSVFFALVAAFFMTVDIKSS